MKQILNPKHTLTYSNLLQFLPLLLISAHLPAQALEKNAGQDINTAIEEVRVTAEFRDNKLMELANSVTVINQKAIAARGATHLEQLLNLAPNVNFSTGSSRGRFFQIRGIGERSQFVDPVNPSVGLVIDGMDFTGLGLAASTLDIKQIEVLRGPQGTLYGANALAGLINLKSNEPSEIFTGKISVEFAEYDSRILNLVASGPVTDRLSYRVAYQQQQSDGFIENDFLHRDDTNNIDEQAIRGKLVFNVNDELAINVSAFYMDADNGYDAFSLTQNRHTTSDQPGEDKQQSLAGSIQISWQGLDLANVEALVSAIDADTDYGFDEDWSYVNEFDTSLFPYSSADLFSRERENISIDLRLISKPDQKVLNNTSDWTLGIYARQEQENLKRTRYANLAFDGQFNNSFDTDNYALYGQLETAITDKITLTTGLRTEQRDAEYSDSAGISEAPEDTFWGGRIALEYQLNPDIMLYGLVSRGYKSGGVNGQIISAAQTNPAITPAVFFFDTEKLWNYEIGLKGEWLDGQLQTQIAGFYQDRKDAQAKQSIFNPSDFSFDDYLSNAEGNAIGLELEFFYQASNAIDLYGSLGWLDSEFDSFITAAHVDARDDWNGIPLTPVNLDGRDVAHAPNYQFVLGGEFRFTDNLYLRLEVEGKDQFYFSNSHNEKSGGYELLNARFGYRSENWTLSLWGRNLTDQDVETRGFYFSNQFGNNPANGYAPETYTQLGEPRIIGVTASYDF